MGRAGQRRAGGQRRVGSRGQGCPRPGPAEPPHAGRGAAGALGPAAEPRRGRRVRGAERCGAVRSRAEPSRRLPAAHRAGARRREQVSGAGGWVGCSGGERRDGDRARGREVGAAPPNPELRVHGRGPGSGCRSRLGRWLGKGKKGGRHPAERQGEGKRGFFFPRRSVLRESVTPTGDSPVGF